MLTLSLRTQCERTLKSPIKLGWNIFALRSIFKQDCIPVGCVPPAHWPYLPACSARGRGVSAWGGVCSQGGAPGPGGVCSGGGGVCSGGMSAPRGVCLLRGGVPGPGGYLVRYSPPVDRHTPVNILPCPKLRLRAVKIWLLQMHLFQDLFRKHVSSLWHYNIFYLGQISVVGW